MLADLAHQLVAVAVYVVLGVLALLCIPIKIKGVRWTFTGWRHRSPDPGPSSTSPDHEAEPRAGHRR